VFWEASEPRVVVTEPELIREVFSARWALAYGKSPIQQRCCEHFLGRGLVMANGHDWARQRRAIAPAFHLERLKVIPINPECRIEVLLSILFRNFEIFR
jgi:cytokinin trans-hydroxylase